MTTPKKKDIIRGINDNIHCTSYYFLQQWCSIVYNYQNIFPVRWVLSAVIPITV